MAQLVGVKSDSDGMYNHDHKSVYSIASLDFGELVPVRKKDLVPRHRITHFKGRGFLRLAPQVFPSYGRCTFNSAAFVCSESQILESAQAFHDGKLVYKGKGFNLPYSYFSSMIKMFTSRSAVIGTPEANYDDNDHLCILVKHTDLPQSGWFNVDTAPSQSVQYSPIDENQYTFMAPYVASINGTDYILYGFWRLTRFGCRYYKILKGCAFDFPSFGNEVSTSFASLDTLYDKYAKTPFNLMPFLAYCHIYQDYFLNPNMYATSLFVQYLHNIHDLEPIVDTGSGAQLYIPSSGAISSDLIHFFLTNIRVPHHRGLYLNSWNSPLSPLGDSPTTQVTYPDSGSIIGPYLPEISPAYSEQVNLNYGNKSTPILETLQTGQANYLRGLTVFGQRFLNNVYQWGRRNGLFGSKYWEQFWSRFGIKPNDFNSNYCSKLFDSSQDIDFSAVMSNADTGNAGKTLGDFAGFGIGSLNFDFNYKSSDYGYIFVLSWLQPIPILLHGVDPAGLRRNYLDYWNGLWDGKTLRAIPMMELSFAKRGDLVPTINGDRKIFGYCNLYDEMRHERDIVLGDFVTSPQARNFLFCRDIGFWRSRAVNKVAPQANAIHYLPVPLFESDLSDVFQMSYKNGDRFYLQFTFDIIEKSPVKSDSAALDLNGEGDQLMEIGGTQVS